MIKEISDQLFLQCPAISILIDGTTGAIIRANQAAAEFYGYLAQELIGMRVTDLNSDRRLSADVILDKIYKCSGDAGKCLRDRHILKNGEIRDVGIFSKTLKLEGELVIYSIIIDLTPSLKIKEELEQNKDRFTLVLEGAKAGIWDWDTVNDRVEYDYNWKVLLGYEEQEIANSFEEWQNRWHPEDAERIDQAVQDYLSGKSDKYVIEHRLRHKDGSYRWILTTGKLTRDDGGQPIRWVGSNIDITAQKELTQLRLDSERKLKDFAQAIPDVSAIVDEDGRFVDVFGRIEEVLGYTAHLEGLTFHEFFPRNLADKMLQNVQQTIKTGNMHSFVIDTELKSKKRYFEGRIAPMDFLYQGRRTAAIIVSDISERLHMEKTLQFTYELQRKSDLINDILSEKITYNERMVEMVKKWGIDLSAPLCCCLISVNKDNRSDNSDLNYDVQQCKNDILFSLENNFSHLVWDNHDKIGVLCQNIPVTDIVTKCMDEAVKIKQTITKQFPDLTITIGISDLNRGFSSIQKSYQEAWNTLISAQCQTPIGGGGIFHYRDMGLFQILASLYGKNDTSDYVQKMIGSLIDYDLERGTDFVLTLEELLRSTNLKDSALKLHIHHKTLVFRKQRVEKILGVSLEHFETRLTLAAAIKLNKLNSINQ